MATRTMTGALLWKRGTDNALDTYVGEDNELVMDYRDAANPKMTIHDGLTPGGASVGGGVTSGIVTPSITAPLDGAVDLNKDPVISTSAFTGVGDDGSVLVHGSTDWEFAADSNFTLPIFSSLADTAHLTQLDLASIGEVFPYNSTVYARVRFNSSTAVASNWSNTISFTTRPYPVTEIQQVTSSNVIGGDAFGSAVAISANGQVLAVGAHRDDNARGTDAGIVYLFKLVNGVYQEFASVYPSDIGGSYLFGRGVSLSADGSLMLAGCGRYATPEFKGSAYLYTVDASTDTVTQVQKIQPSGVSITDGYSSKVYLSGDGTKAIIGAFLDDNGGLYETGAIYLYDVVNNALVNEVKMTSPDRAQYDRYGYGVALSNDASLMAVGAYLDDNSNGTNAGAVYVYKLNGTGTYDHIQKLSVSDGYAGQTMGASLAFAQGNTFLYIGTQSDDNANGTNAGAFYVFKNDGTDTFIEIAKVLASDGAANDYFADGLDASEDGGYIASGSGYADVNGTADLGKVYIYN